MPENCNDVKFNGVLNVLKAARRIDVEKIIYASSPSVYGDKLTLPKEKTCVDCQSLHMGSQDCLAKLICKLITEFMG